MNSRTGNFDMHLKVSMMDSCVASHRQGYLEMLHKIFTHIKKCYDAEMSLCCQNQALIISISKFKIGSDQSLAAQSRINVSCTLKLLLLEACGLS